MKSSIIFTTLFLNLTKLFIKKKHQKKTKYERDLLAKVAFFDRLIDVMRLNLLIERERFDFRLNFERE